MESSIRPEKVRQDARTGNWAFPQRAVANGRYFASPVPANDHIDFISLDEENVSVMKLGGKQPVIVARNPAFEERITATPVIADDALYLPTAGHLCAVGTKSRRQRVRQWLSMCTSSYWEASGRPHREIVVSW
jgi:hypothetical protein